MLAGHDVVGAAVGLAENHGQLRDGGFGKGIEQFRPVSDDTTPFLVGSWQETRHVLKGQDGNVERVAKANKTCCLVAGVNVQTSGEYLGLIRHHADGMTAEMTKSNHDVLRPFSLNLHEAPVVQHLSDDVENIVRFGWVFGNDAVKAVAGTVLAVGGLLHGWALKVVGR